ncbi:hypothetical protein [Ralstonia mannitolilytica]|uniref:hypothetical protein n=1 Tax=Ralstonia mannitolilytica TaxID=105219 RepID=UPI00374A00DC
MQFAPAQSAPITSPPTVFRQRVFFFEERILNTLNVEYRKVEALIPYARNPRTHTDEQVAILAALLVGAALKLKLMEGSQ